MSSLRNGTHGWGYWGSQLSAMKPDIQRTLGMIFRLPADYDLTVEFDEATLIRNNIPRINWRGWSPNSVMVLDKGDLLLRG